MNFLRPLILYIHSILTQTKPNFNIKKLFLQTFFAKIVNVANILRNIFGEINNIVSKQNKRV